MKYLEGSKIETHLSQNVYDEVANKVNEVTAYVASILRTLNLYLSSIAMKQAGAIGSSDIHAIENFFSDAVRTLGRQKQDQYTTKHELLDNIETFIIRNLNLRLKESKGSPIDFSVFFSEIATEVIRINGDIKNRYVSRTAKSPVINMPPEPTILANLKQKLPIKDPDLYNLCEVATYQKSNKKWSVFVALDYKDVIGWKEKIYEICRVMCSDPLYAENIVSEIKRSGNLPPNI